MTTKDLIYQTAKDLFYEHGYLNLGMRDLAKNVGIKASSIYNHYKSKEDILVQIADELVGYMKSEVYPLYKQTHLNPRDFFTNISINTAKFFELNHINHLTRILVSTFDCSATVKQVFLDEFILKPRTALNYYFKRLMEQGKMKSADSMLAAKTYHSFFIYHFYEKYLLADPNGYLTKNMDLFKQHIDLFLDYFGVK